MTNREKQKILLAMDGSDASIRTVDYPGETLQGYDCEVTLIHVIRSEEKEFVEKAEKSMAPVFAMAKSRLESWGFGPRRIRTKVITGAMSRAGEIVREARDGGYSTIMIGRRRFPKAREYFMGRISNKVIQLTAEQLVLAVT